MSNAMSDTARMPRVISVEGGEDSAALVLAVPEDLIWFPGHFPGNPVLPGVVLVDWAMQLADGHLTLPGCFAGLRTVKFHRRVRPGDRLILELALEPDRLAWSYRVAAEDQTKLPASATACAEGVVRLWEVGT